MKALTRIESIPLPPALRPAMIPSLPAWAVSLTAAVRPELQRVKDATGRDTFAEVLVLPAAMMPTQEQRAAIERHVDSLRSLLRETPQADGDAETRTATAVTKLLLVLPGARKSEVGAEVRNEVYLDVLDDVTCWAVEAAIRGWHRHECGADERGRPYDYRWAPDPGTLRQLALREMHRMESRIRELMKPLAAIRYVDQSADLERGRIAMIGLWKTFRGGPDALRAIDINKAFEIGSEP